MKNFDDFKEYMKENGSDIAKTIQDKTDRFIDNNNAENLITYSNTYTQIALMEMLEHYHNWLNNQ